jgi:putative endonuclease
LAQTGVLGHTLRSSVVIVPSDDPPPQPPHPAATSSEPRNTDRRPALGRRGEEHAAAHMHRLGFSPIGRNERTRYGEIDLIAFDGRTLVFAEVKTRRVNSRRQGVRPDQQPLVWLRPRQRARLRRLAAAWLREEKHIRPTAHTIRFDAIGVILDTKDRLVSLDHIEGAW